MLSLLRANTRSSLYASSCSRIKLACRACSMSFDQRQKSCPTLFAHTRRHRTSTQRLLPRRNSVFHTLNAFSRRRRRNLMCARISSRVTRTRCDHTDAHRLNTARSRLLHHLRSADFMNKLQSQQLSECTKNRQTSSTAAQNGTGQDRVVRCRLTSGAASGPARPLHSRAGCSTCSWPPPQCAGSTTRSSATAATPSPPVPPPHRRGPSAQTQ